MRIKELFEDTNKHITFCFGRMNPPTIGHKKLMDAMASVGGDMKIFVSQTQDKKKNPLDYATKIKFIRAIIPEYANDVVDDPSLNTIGKVASHLYNQGYRHATFVAGSDRLEDMSRLLKDYNGVEGKGHGFYKFDTLDFKSSGDREDGAEGVEGVSASNARAAAAAGNFEQFATSTGAGNHAKALYDAVRKGMGIKDSVSEADISRRGFLKGAGAAALGGAVGNADAVAMRMQGSSKAEKEKAAADKAREEEEKRKYEEIVQKYVKIISSGQPLPPKMQHSYDTLKDFRKDVDKALANIPGQPGRVDYEQRKNYHLMQKEHIVKVKGGYELKSKSSGKNLGKYPTKAGAEKRERQVQYFKHKG